MRFIFCFLLLLSFSGCSLLGTSTKTGFADDYYTVRKDSLKEKVYVDFEEDEITIYSVSGRKESKLKIDPTVPGKIFPKEEKSAELSDLKFRHSNFDLDLFTMPVKLRPAQNDVPWQLNANLNGAVYAGYRTDKFNLHYTPNPLGKVKRSVTHLGISFGVFSGIGNTFMSPTNTNFYITTEYDGVVWTKGIAAIFALNNFTAGLALGTDNLTDKNKSHWNYEGRPWLGLVLGLNLN